MKEIIYFINCYQKLLLCDIITSLLGEGHVYILSFMKRGNCKLFALFCLMLPLAIGNTNKPGATSSIAFLLVSLVCETLKPGKDRLRASTDVCDLIVWGSQSNMSTLDWRKFEKSWFAWQMQTVNIKLFSSYYTILLMFKYSKMLNNIKIL